MPPSETPTLADPAQWRAPAAQPATALHLRNSLTKSKVPFHPMEGKEVKWYTCGPTVYDAAHLGHARAYITFDILRRIMTDYFGYNVTYVMNITDVDDKIILAARQKFLFSSKFAAAQALDAAAVSEVLAHWQQYVETKLSAYAAPGTATPSWSPDQIERQWDAYRSALVRPDDKIEPKFDLYLKTATRAVAAMAASSKLLSDADPSKRTRDATRHLLEETRDIVAASLDKASGHTLSDPSLFREYAASWERAFFSDMEALGVKKPDLLTRVSEYIPEIVAWVEKIMTNGYAYEVKGSIYFDSQAFDSHERHHYAKLEPGAKNNLGLIQEGEGSLSTGAASDKRAPSDFALWKTSKPGEPAWDSPWGPGRPGWHIECSVMASEVLGDTLDIHSGGIDLAFPHHDNEIAQSEAYFDHDQWTNYFLHAGHLHIEGQKMSKSLKNFITIREALEQHPASRIRLMFLLHSWDAVLDYKVSTLEECRAVEQQFLNYINNVRALERQEAGSTINRSRHQYHDAEKTLYAHLVGARARVHAALCDNFNTPQVMAELRDLVSKANIYMTTAKRAANIEVLVAVSGYVTRMLSLFGLSNLAAPDTAASSEDRIYPFAEAISRLRDQLRSLSQSPSLDNKKILALCDAIRDEVLPDLGVVLDDQDDGRALVKLVDAAQLVQEREAKRAKEAARAAEKAQRLQEQQAKRLEKIMKGQIAPCDMFRLGEHAGQYTAYDERGIPITDHEGAELPKSRKKKFEKEFATQTKLHEEYLRYMREEAATAVP
ncbi:hypothetical protein CXG81DRAFT_28008 [Caulochytrium protostelioides]|uniref:cysteine--tRNA ligase n=1 Tax=Caulochytrium protostelioides TaxID=1555241 RepID=A0A4P9WZ59_9FUNG|nr:hypothetical protein CAUPRSCDRAFT_6162 [Caulochytrium protostelioides]RKO99221.1 hypothetical protein CXG81DRAFT_28008 [Caulochytrium protostelioides]|eukprot:RKO99221.1 hypothetical protein CXG81DRAFT_28008 [Caulochytrium protostelioides]